MPVAHKSIIVTGAASGIGLATARKFAAEGARLVLGDRNEEGVATAARDLGGEGIRINTIMPGIMQTPPMLAVPAEMLESLSAQVPFPKRLGDPAEFGSLVLEIVRNAYLNGETIRLDGAIRMGAK